MATQTMGQLYCGNCFGKKWNRAWSNAASVVFHPINDVTVDDIDQDVFDELLAYAFWYAVDRDYNGTVPERVEDMCTVPERPTRTLHELHTAALAAKGLLK